MHHFCCAYVCLHFFACTIVCLTAPLFVLAFMRCCVSAGGGVFSPAQIRDRVAASLAVLDLPPHTLAAFTLDVQGRPDRDTICATTGSMIQYYAVWKHAAAGDEAAGMCMCLCVCLCVCVCLRVYVCVHACVHVCGCLLYICLCSPVYRCFVGSRSLQFCGFLSVC